MTAGAVVPEVSRGAYRVPFGTDPEEATRLAADYRVRRRKLIAAARRRRMANLEEATDG